MNYRGIIIEESLIDKSILDDVKTLSTKIVDEGTPDVWHMRKVQIEEQKVHAFADRLANSLDGNVRWYVHLYHEDPAKDRMIVIFYHKRFNVSKDNASRAIEYGLREGIPAEQLDFKPHDVLEEKW